MFLCFIFLRKYAEMSILFEIQGLLGTVLALFMGRDKIGGKKVMKCSNWQS